MKSEKEVKRKRIRENMEEVDQIRQQLTLLTGELNALNTARNQEIAQLRADVQSARELAIHSRGSAQNNDDVFKIPDPIKSLPTFEGNKRRLQHWLNSVEKALHLYETATPRQKNVYFQSVLNKLEGKAKDCVCLAGEVETLEQLRKVLTDTLGDRQEIATYKSQLWLNKMEDSVHSYYKKCFENMQRIKSLAKLDPKYARSWEAINAFIEEDALAAFISGLKRPFFGYCQSAKPTNIEEAYAFLCKFECNDKIYRNSTNIQRDQGKKEFNRDKPPFPKPNEKSFKNFKNSPEPMEIDPSIRAKTNFTRKSINNHEIDEDANKSDSEGEEIEEISEEEFDVNFCSATKHPTTT